MIEKACQCPDGFGLPHSHVYDMVHAPCTVPPSPLYRGIRWGDTGWVRLWVDWKAVARA